MAKNLQNLRTERAIQAAFIKLVNQKGFNQVTIGDIADEALINRQTFYYHYQDKYQLTEVMISEMVDQYDDLYQNYVSSHVNQDNLPERITRLFPKTNSFWTTNRDKINALFSIEFNDHSLEKELKTRFRRSLPELLGRKPLALEEHIFPGIILAIIEYVIDTGQAPDKDEIIETFSSVSEVFK